MYFWEVRGGSVKNMNVRMTNDPLDRWQGSYLTHIPTEFAAAGRDAISMVAFFAYFTGRMETDAVQLVDFRISCAKLHNTYCRRCHRQSTSSLQ